MEKRKDETLTRKTSLLKLHDPDEDSSDDLEKHLMQDQYANESFILCIFMIICIAKDQQDLLTKTAAIFLMKLDQGLMQTVLRT